MSVLVQYKRLQDELQQLQAKEAALKESPELQRMMEAGGMLRELMDEYDLSAQDLVDIVRPGYTLVKASAGEQPRRARRQRPMKVYTNPHTGEKVETRGANQKVLRQWREVWGNDEVASWAADQ